MPTRDERDDSTETADGWRTTRTSDDSRAVATSILTDGPGRCGLDREAVAPDGDSARPTETDLLASDDAAAAGIPAPHGIPGARGYRRGDSVGRYLILGTLGKGGMGMVYSAYDPELDRKVALKLLRPRRRHHGRRARERARMRLEREARALAKLSHPNVVQVYDVGVKEWPAPIERTRRTSGPVAGAGEPLFDMYLAMEHVEGVSLREWQRAEPRPSQSDILRVYLDACRGLAASHRAGLIHRDVKPANILVGHDDRVRVADFGLAAALERDSHDETTDEGSASDEQTPSHVADQVSSISSASPFEARLDVRLTQTGTVLGTPKYMAPEQHAGGEIGPAVDQYAICVSLYEALYDRFPFVHGQSHDRSAGPPHSVDGFEPMRELLRAKLEVSTIEPPADSDVPAWIAAALQRGLAPAPEERYASMDELIAAFERDPAAQRRARRRNIALALAAAVLAALAVFGWLRGAEPVDRCAGVGELMNGAWDAATRARVRERFLASGVSYAADTVDRVTSRLDAYAAAWLGMRAAQCRMPADALAVARSLCMERRRDQIAALAGIFGGTAVADGGAAPPFAIDAELVSRAVRATANLPPLTDCSDEQYLAARVPPPDDPATRARMKAHQLRVDRLRALHEAGRYRDGMAEGRAVLAALGPDAYPPLLAEALFWNAQLNLSSDEYAAAEQLAMRAVRAAARGKDDVLIAKSWSLALVIIGYWQSRTEEASLLMNWGEIVTIRADDDLTRASVFQNEALVYLRKGEYEEARASYERALAIRIGVLGESHILVASSLTGLGTALHWVGKWEDSRVTHERALALYESILGPEHPRLASTLTNLGIAYFKLRTYDESMVAYRRALAIRESASGNDDVLVAIILENMGITLGAVGELEAAMAAQQRAVRIQEKKHGEDDRSLISVLCNLGNTLRMLGRYDEAIASHRRALTIAEAVHGREHAVLLYPLSSLGEDLLAKGELDAASLHLERSRAVLETAKGTEHPELAEILLPLGEVALARGKPGRAVVLIEQALSLENAALQPQLWFGLARALWARNAAGDRPRAVERAIAARDEYAAMSNELGRAKLVAWLAAHRLR